MGASELAEYLLRLDQALPLTRKQRKRIVAEVADGLQSAVEAHRAAGMAPSEIERVVVEEFGDPEELADEFAHALAPGIARRVGLALVISGPVVGLAWVAVVGRGFDWASRISSVLASMPYVAVLLAVTVPAAIVAVLSGSTSLRRNMSSRVATLAARFAAFGCVLADVLLVTSVAGGLQSGRLAVSGLIVVPVMLSTLRMAATSSAVWRLSRLHAAGY